MRSRYDVYKNSLIENNNGLMYPDIFTFPIEEFVGNRYEKRYKIRGSDIDFFYLVCYREYGVSHYDDIVLWLNGIASVRELEVGQVIILPDLADLEQFFIDYSRRG